MTLAGLSEHQIAKRTATPKATVQAAKAAAQARRCGSTPTS